MVKRIMMGVLAVALFWPDPGWCQRLEDSLGCGPAERRLLQSVRKDQQDRELRQYQERSLQLQEEQNRILRDHYKDYDGTQPVFPKRVFP